MNTLYVSDLDGTLLNDNQEITTEAVEILNHLIDRGLQFTLATARSIESVREIIKGLNLKVPLILNNGVFIYDLQNSQIIKSNFLPKHLGSRIVQTYLRFGLNPLVSTIDSVGNAHIYYRGVFNQSEENFISNRLRKGDKRFRRICNYDQCIEENIITINAIDVPDRLQAAYDEYVCQAGYVCYFGPDIYTSGFHWLEIAGNNATKKEAVLYLKNSCDFERLVCFGDHLNDLSMFEAADEKYAVRNAHPTIIEAATKVIESNNDNGVPLYLKSIFAERT